jgi:chondroitin 4-sulfotransferase 11
MGALKYKLKDYHARFHTRYLADFSFVHINKTGGSSVEKALGLPFQHRTAVEMRALMGEKRWESRFSFAFVRNPWDKVASHYAYRVQTNQTGLGAKQIPFKEWVRLTYGDQDPHYYDQPKMFMPQLNWVADEHGKLMVDMIGRYEMLAQDFARVCESLGRRAQLPHLKRSTNRDHRKLYDTETIEVVGRWFDADVRAFGYAFE